MTTHLTTLVMEERIKDCPQIKRLVKRNDRRVIRLELVRYAQVWDCDRPTFEESVVYAGTRQTNAQTSRE